VSVRWISYVWDQSPFKGERLLLHLALADFANDEGECWPSQPTLARKARCSVTWVRLGLRDLQRDGLLEVVSNGSGRGHRTQYRLLRKGVTTNGVSENGETPAQERVHSAHSLTYIKNRQEPSLDLDSGFNEFWKAYPRRVARAAALQCWRRIMKAADAPSLDVVMAAVDRYAKSATDPQFIAHPATWLRQQRWMDDSVQETVAVRDRWKTEKDNSESQICVMVRLGNDDEAILEFIHGRPTEVQEHLANFLVEFRRTLAAGK
jgi:hypothetical protein